MSNMKNVIKKYTRQAEDEDEGMGPDLDDLDDEVLQNMFAITEAEHIQDTFGTEDMVDMLLNGCKPINRMRKKELVDELSDRISDPDMMYALYQRAKDWVE